METDSRGKPIIEPFTYDRGDLVKLWSGGPDMTVEDNSDGAITVVWFDACKLMRDTLPSACIKLVWALR